MNINEFNKRPVLTEIEKFYIWISLGLFFEVIVLIYISLPEIYGYYRSDLPNTIAAIAPSI